MKWVERLQFDVQRFSRVGIGGDIKRRGKIVFINGVVILQSQYEQFATIIIEGEGSRLIVLGRRKQLTTISYVVDIEVVRAIVGDAKAISRQSIVLQIGDRPVNIKVGKANIFPYPCPVGAMKYKQQ